MHAQDNNNQCGFDNVVFALKHFYSLIKIQNKFTSLKLILVYVTTSSRNRICLISTSQCVLLPTGFDCLSFCDVEHLHDLSRPTAIWYHTQQL